jgi:hypothetical protein
MATLTKFADSMRGVNSKIADLKAVTSELTLAVRPAIFPRSLQKCRS